MNKQEKLKEILFSEFDKLIEGADIYDHRGSKWIIFTNEKIWVVEFTKEKTLWFNYHRFNEVLVLFAMDCYDDRNYIKEWYEKRFIFNHKVENTIQNEVRSTKSNWLDAQSEVENTIQNGVRSTKTNNLKKVLQVENTIQNGVRSTSAVLEFMVDQVENTIQNGVRSTYAEFAIRKESVENTIQNGVKDIIDGLYRPVHDTIENGVVVTRLVNSSKIPFVKKVIQNGVKDTNYRLVFDQQGIECAIENNINELDPRFFQLDGIVEDTIQNGIKRVGGVKRDRKERIELTIEKGEKS